MPSYDKLIEYHARLVGDRGRTEAYRLAIAEVVRAGDVVLDIGTGTGILALLACQAGARRVYAVEAGEVIELAKEVCRTNAVEDRITFINELSYAVDLPEPIDVIVTDTGHTFGLQGGMLGSVVDARKRFLRKGGRVVPQSVELFTAAVELPDTYALVDVWRSAPSGLDFSAALPCALNSAYVVRFDSSALLSEPVSLGVIPFTDTQTPHFRGERTCVASRPGTMHGVGGWVVVRLTDRHSISNNPVAPTCCWKHAFFPIETPVPLRPGDRVRIAIETYDGREWKWQVERVDETKSGAGPLDRRLQPAQSTFFAFPWNAAALHKTASGYVPRLSRRGEAEQHLLGLLDGKHSIGELEQMLFERYPDCFKTRSDAGGFVREVVARCT